VTDNALRRRRLASRAAGVVFIAERVAQRCWVVASRRALLSLPRRLVAYRRRGLAVVRSVLALH